MVAPCPAAGWTSGPKARSELFCRAAPNLPVWSRSWRTSTEPLQTTRSSASWSRLDQVSLPAAALTWRHPPSRIIPIQCLQFTDCSPAVYRLSPCSVLRLTACRERPGVEVPAVPSVPGAERAAAGGSRSAAAAEGGAASGGRAAGQSGGWGQRSNSLTLHLFWQTLLLCWTLSVPEDLLTLLRLSWIRSNLPECPWARPWWSLRIHSDGRPLTPQLTMFWC